MESTIKKIFWATWTMNSLLLFGTLTTNIEITNGLIRSGLIFILIFGIVKIVTIKKPWTLTKILALSSIVFGLFIIVKLNTDWRSDWKTQTILYKNNHLSNRTIEFQLQDKGALGFNRRTVNRLKLFPFVSWTKELTDENLENIDKLTWDKVDIDVNEQRLKDV